jgi:cbb3-type cytochrome oxidase subunit 3
MFVTCRQNIKLAINTKGKYSWGMLTSFAYNCFIGYIPITLVFLLCTGYVYRVNSKRAADDPEKKDYAAAAIPMVLAWPIYLLVAVFLFVLKALLYGVFLVLFTVALIAIRKPFLFVWLEKIATKIGTIFLKVNTFLLRTLFPQTRLQSI